MTASASAVTERKRLTQRVQRMAIPRRSFEAGESVSTGPRFL
jgi:hypothetical protein